MKACFVIGPARSGTTLMISLLDSHPELSVVPLEIKFYAQYFERLNANVSYAKLNDFMLNQSKIRVIKEHSTCTLDPLNTGFVNFKNVDYQIVEKEMQRNIMKYSNDFKLSMIDKYICDFHVAYNKALGLPKKKGFAVKEGNHGLPYINEIKRDFKNARFVVMVRDPRDMYSSLKSIARMIRAGGKYPSFGDEISVMEYLFSYRNQGKRCYDYMNYFNESNDDKCFLFVRYEDLVNNSRSVMKDVASFIGINFDEILLKPTTAGNPWYGNASNKNKFDSINNSRTIKWRKELKKSEILLIEYFLINYMKQWNYDVIFPEVTLPLCLKNITISDIAGYKGFVWKDYLRPFYRTIKYLIRFVYYSYQLLRRAYRLKSKRK